MSLLVTFFFLSVSGVYVYYLKLIMRWKVIYCDLESIFYTLGAVCSFYGFVKLCHETQLCGPFLQHSPHEGTSSQNSVLLNVLVLGVMTLILTGTSIWRNTQSPI